MIDVVVVVIWLVFALFLMLTFISVASFLPNLIILIILYFLITKDLKSSSIHKFYITSFFLTASFFIFSNVQSINHFLILTDKLLLSLVSVACLLIYFFANAINSIFEFSLYVKRKYIR